MGLRNTLVKAAAIISFEQLDCLRFDMVVELFSMLFLELIGWVMWF